jgi:lysophospholipase L1-like esterase
MRAARATAGAWTRGAAVALAILAGCLAGRAAPPRNPTPPDAPQVLFFGSSTIAGSGASSPERRFTSLLAQRAGWREINEGLPGSTLTDVPGRSAVSAEVRVRAIAASGIHPAVVVVMYGANDAISGVPLGEPGTPGTFRHAAAAVLRALHGAFPRAALIVCTPQPGRRLQGSREPYDTALAEEARTIGAVLLRGDRAFAAEALPRYAADAIHLNDAGHAALAAHLERALLDAGVIAEPRIAHSAFDAGSAVMP